MTGERLARFASVLALALLAGLVATSATATPGVSAPEAVAGTSQVLDGDSIANHPTPTEEPTTSADSPPTGPPTASVQPTSTRDLLLVVGGFLTGGALVGVGVVAGRWST